MRYRASVTYEFPTVAPDTVWLPIVAASHQKAASVAVRALKLAHPGRQPSSIVVVLELEREDAVRESHPSSPNKDPDMPAAAAMLENGIDREEAGV